MSECDSAIKGATLNLSGMVIACALFAMLGWLAARRPETDKVATIAAVLALLMVLSRGYYWAVFPRGEGLLTANKITAVLAFVVCYIIGAVRGRLGFHRDRADALRALSETRNWDA